MSWVTLLWSMNAAACLTLAVVNLIVWLNARNEWGHLLFFAAAASASTIAILELLGMHAGSILEFSNLLRWAHVPYCVLIVSIVWFARIFMGAGRIWLAWTITGLRTVALLPNFLATYNLNYGQVTALKHIRLLGEDITIIEGKLNPWMSLGQLSSLLLLAYLLDASRTIWRRGEKRRALFFGGSLILFTLFAALDVVLVQMNVLQLPYMVSFAFFGIIVVMAYELSRDVIRASRLSRELRATEAGLRETQQRLSLAADAAHLGIWVRDLKKDEIWASENWRDLFGFTHTEELIFERILERMHPEDRAIFNQNFTKAISSDGHYETEYRLILPNGQMRWISSRGRVETNGGGAPKLLRGISVDITDRKRAELEVAQQRNELTHLTRVTMLGELSGSIAHELNQPLTAILCNAKAIGHLLDQERIDLGEIREALKDIVAEDKRAGEVIHRLRLLLTKGEVQFQPVDLNEIVEEVLKLVRVDLGRHGVTAQTELPPGLPKIDADRVHLQQVVLNLVLNAADAMANNPADSRALIVRTGHLKDEGLFLSVTDDGIGIAPEQLEKVFEPFYTTKSHGMGLGLSVCRTIVAAHGGKLLATNNPTRGATFRFVLPFVREVRA